MFLMRNCMFSLEKPSQKPCAGHLVLLFGHLLQNRLLPSGIALEKLPTCTRKFVRMRIELSAWTIMEWTSRLRPDSYSFSSDDLGPDVPAGSWDDEANFDSLGVVEKHFGASNATATLQDRDS